ncbi:M28 family metallopeptidase [Urechidicola vernalis]|uniref:M28 family metallopeptidase n=1 Tax=Urechidicola vernalis TaxID=3075600 RepID=A0ABU2Y537_9FLAO|nr:M28 family metallopeptidase [Urechidicola sp. P050]MDT0553291.1 M28 family metallopeptidase [Urechidicola sp. P050]
MKKISTLSAMLLAGLTFAQTAEKTTEIDTAVKYANTITIEDLKEDLTILASDALEGRETGKRGQKMAAAYIKTHFEELGLEGPAEAGNGYYQNVPLKTSKPGDIYIKFGDTQIKNLEDFLYYGPAYNIEELTTNVVFGGAGSTEELKGLDIKGKTVLINTTDRNTRQSALEYVQKNGGKMLFVIYANNEEEHSDYYNKYKNYFDRESIGLDKGDGAEIAGIVFISPAHGAAMFETTFDKLQKAIASNKGGKKNAYKKLKESSISYKIDYASKKIISENVLGYLEGTDLKDELLVLTSHYDHEGIKNGEIYNGADDDGSGTVAVMDIAEAFAKAKADGNGPRRSILFMTVTAEEKGLLGSEYYADNPIFPLENTVADLNIDMIGRVDDRDEIVGKEYVSLVGSDKLSSELHEISERANKKYTDLYLDYTYNDEGHPERIYYRSDHWNFAKNGIPVIFYTTGSHPDYHKPTDTVDKIEFELMTKRTKLVFYTAWEIANRDGRLIVDKGEKEDKVSK